MKSLLPTSLAFFSFITCLLAQKEFSLPHNGSKRALLSASAQTQVNPLGGSHDTPAITSLKDGQVIIVWSGELAGSTTYTEVYVQKYDLNGAANGGWFQVNTGINGYQFVPAIVSLEDGGFVVIWGSYVYDSVSGCPGVYAQRYNANGSLNGTNFIVECFATSMYPYPYAAGLFDGGFIIAWHYGTNTDYDVFAKVYNADGSVRTPTFRVHTYTNKHQSNPAVTSCADGGFIIIWESEDQDGDSYGIYGRKFQADGTPVNAEFQVNTFNQGAQQHPAISSLLDGKFVVAWDSLQDNVAGTVSVGIYGKIFNADTTLFKSEFRINSYVPGDQKSPDIAALPNGNFVVAWYGDGQNLTPYEISAQVFSIDGVPSGTEFTVTTHTNVIYFPIITAIMPNGYAIVWQSINAVMGYSVYVRWFTCPTATPMIYDNACHASCPAVAPNKHKDVCYLTCPNMVAHLYNQECYAACPSVAPYLYNRVCYTSPQIPPTNETLGDSFTTTVTTATEVSTKATQAAALAVSAIKFTSAAAVWFNSLSEIVMYVRYLQISYPERLQYIINQPDPEFISFEFVSDLSEKLQEELTLYPIPERFQSSGLHSSFLVNFLPSILFLLGIMGFIIIACVVTHLIKSSKRIHWISMSIKQSMKWNYLLAYFTGYFPDIALTSSLEFRSNNFSSVLDILSFATCIVVNLGVLIVILKIMSIVLALQNSKRQALQQKDNNPLKALQEKLKDYEIVFESFKDDSFLQQAYTIIFISKLYLFNVIIGYLFEYPIFQTLLLNIMGGVTLVYLAIKRPFKQKIEFISILAQESILQIVHGCTLGLALIDSKKIDAVDESKETLGVIIITSNTIFSVVGAVFLVITVLTSLRDLYNWLKAGKPVYSEATHLTNTSFSLQNRSIQEQVQVTDISVTNMLSHHENTSWNPVQVRRNPKIKRIRRQQIHPILSYIRNISAANYGNNA